MLQRKPRQAAHALQRAPISGLIWRSRRLLHSSTPSPPWRPQSVLDEYVKREARPISLRQLTFFGRTLTEDRLLSSANYVRTELPTRLAHRIRDMQTLPYVVVTNSHMLHVYELYYQAFDTLRRVKEIKTVADNERYCTLIKKTLEEHLSIIPRATMGVLECQGLMPPDEMDSFMNILLRSRISRRVIAEQHLALTSTFTNPSSPAPPSCPPNDLVGEVFLKCNANSVVTHCYDVVRSLAQDSSDQPLPMPRLIVSGHHGATFPYILSHLEYIIGELLRNSIQAVSQRWQGRGEEPPPIEVLICEASQHVIFRISDQGGGVPRALLPFVWSFCKGPRREMRLQNLSQVPTMAATLQEISASGSAEHRADGGGNKIPHESSLSSLASRPPNLRLGMGLPMSKVYAEYWAGSLELHSLEGYGVDVFLCISKLGNRNEQLTTRAMMDAV